jgi:MFS family permease
MGKTSALKSALLQREFLSVLIVVVNAISWFFPLYFFLESVLGSFLDYTSLIVVFGVLFVAIFGFAIMGNVLVKRFSSRDSFLAVWMFIGILASFSIITLETQNLVNAFLVSLFLGAALGFGFPTCLSYFGNHSSVENRGWLGGITFFASGLIILILGVILNIAGSVFVGTLVLGAWRGIGLLSFLLVKRKQDYMEEKTIEVSYWSVLRDRSFLLYLLPWIMFCITNFLERPIVNDILGAEIALFVPIAEFGIGGVVALIGGWFADSVGRKRILMVGFIALGIGYALLGLFPGIDLFWYLYIGMDGVAWGILLLMFFLVVWSELAGTQNKEKYYLIGLVPFLIATYIQVLFTPFAEDVTVSVAFSLASFFLFIAVLPLLYAPETMPQKKIELKRLRKFADEARKAKEKYEREKKS